MMPKDISVKESMAKYSSQYFKNFVQRLLSGQYMQFSSADDFQELMNSVLKEVVDYFNNEDISIEELAGYF